MKMKTKATSQSTLDYGGHKKMTSRKKSSRRLRQSRKGNPRGKEDGHKSLRIVRIRPDLQKFRTSV
jgi:hypothetical protein